MKPEEIGIETKTTNEIWNDWKKYNFKSKIMRKKYVFKKWVSLDDFNDALKAEREEVDKKIEQLKKEIASKKKVIESYKED